MAQLRDKIQEDIKENLKAGNQEMTGVLRLLIASIEKVVIAGRGKGGEEMTEADELKVLQSEAKKRKEAIELFEKGGRQDLADKEKAELEIVNKYLPEPVSEEEITEEVVRLIAEGITEFGPLMKKTLEKFQGRTDGKVVGGIVKSKLE